MFFVYVQNVEEVTVHFRSPRRKTPSQPSLAELWTTVRASLIYVIGALKRFASVQPYAPWPVPVAPRDIMRPLRQAPSGHAACCTRALDRAGTAAVEGFSHELLLTHRLDCACVLDACVAREACISTHPVRGVLIARPWQCWIDPRRSQPLGGTDSTAAAAAVE